MKGIDEVFFFSFFLFFLHCNIIEMSEVRLIIDKTLKGCRELRFTRDKK